MQQKRVHYIPVTSYHSTPDQEVMNGMCCEGVCWCFLNSAFYVNRKKAMRCDAPVEPVSKVFPSE